MEEGTVVQVSAMTGWIIGVSYLKDRGYQCWIVNPDLDVLSDGTFYTTSSAAMSAGRTFVERYR
ncbi:hypothetical protein [Pseudanabaena sp. FACHB-2040]|uniref:hypothetical protein n=1 Tax=Pseudanabaena sp. FACHB-2040 TaxID=2692859 RepID=UPI00168355FA|nr:hypothetical protein [Pseudanabaena sp. FACHB-2040]MBD0268671.1 hypothetical protein [Cyanobacteria bacterium Co-bin8]MBD0336449.1 hypothetical protein [Cyanobacteria bacterium Co-bin13]MBD2259632.1 hypothetical protein [Pseudanabaena sp. FACHB-2040]